MYHDQLHLNSCNKNYNPSIGRFMSEDPIGFSSGDTSFYRYTGNNPLNFVDTYGLSDNDVKKIFKRFKELVDKMNKEGLRHENPYYNNIMKFLYDYSGNNYGDNYLACGGQESYVSNDLQSQEYEDLWVFLNENKTFPTVHQYGRARSSNPKDPDIIYDPWNNEIYTTPRGSK
ncbi:RHS repeat-associated core domain-containing protein [Bacteriovorax sp. BAL6_X]|uniref:RHS repeat-associated core domain-containing protein n=1 Tax=Bacteriovorax sp. BAL6_X TaxID=1201290 RepID=UPI00040F2202|nr:RHS repeat-associated core domain-containing protein [Bacteriovorax sp. BAL6_X]